MFRVGATTKEAKKIEKHYLKHLSTASMAREQQLKVTETFLSEEKYMLALTNIAPLSSCKTSPASSDSSH
jgi:hypothetical protein